ncbi:uncharacterized protein LOC110006432 [Amborella trichopoda]|uniref:uncharacterized protein LOC110006432 n=1 Tax=Amborella trichopoda TaxID=13333 RepID=UPI0009BD51D5|nr:uncharacterized protein LOC110006432 [Amborella trichopoda]|eukprot:XP_020517477.1 uncharacterized protein LOC110006432 [Amborella trichopoda]
MKYLSTLLVIHNAFTHISRKGFLSQNVMAAVNFDMYSRYALVGWEGSASYSKVLYDAISNGRSRLAVHEGKYHLVDGGYPTMCCFIGPYQRVRYPKQIYLKPMSSSKSHGVIQEVAFDA